MMGNYDADPNTARGKGQTAAEVKSEAKHVSKTRSAARTPPMSESRKCFLRMMGLARWIK